MADLLPDGSQASHNGKDQQRVDRSPTRDVWPASSRARDRTEFDHETMFTGRRHWTFERREHRETGQ